MPAKPTAGPTDRPTKQGMLVPLWDAEPPFAFFVHAATRGCRRPGRTKTEKRKKDKKEEDACPVCCFFFFSSSFLLLFLLRRRTARAQASPGRDGEEKSTRSVCAHCPGKSSQGHKQPLFAQATRSSPKICRNHKQEIFMSCFVL